VQGTEDDVKSYPNNKKPACPIEAIEHEHAANNRDNPGDVYHPMCLEVDNTLSGCRFNVWQQASKKCDAAEHYEYPTDDCD
jgi:hypothetical protein